MNVTHIGDANVLKDYAAAVAANPDALSDDAKREAVTLNAGASADVPVTPEEDQAMRDLATAQAQGAPIIAVPRTEEWHVTVEGSPIDWYNLCNDLGVTPLYLELPDHRLQLLATLDADPRVGSQSSAIPSFLDQVTAHGFTVVRIKHEVAGLLPGETALYHEAHAVFDGVFRPDRRNASRDLYRAYGRTGARWYLTWRSREPQRVPDPRTLAKGSTLIRVEREIVILDTNPDLDKDWL
jgi:hypothetical protein